MKKKEFKTWFRRLRRAVQGDDSFDGRMRQQLGRDASTVLEEAGCGSTVISIGIPTDRQTMCGDGRSDHMAGLCIFPYVHFKTVLVFQKWDFEDRMDRSKRSHDRLTSLGAAQGDFNRWEAGMLPQSEITNLEVCRAVSLGDATEIEPSWEIEVLIEEGNKLLAKGKTLEQCFAILLGETAIGILSGSEDEEEMEVFRLSMLKAYRFYLETEFVSEFEDENVRTFLRAGEQTIIKTRRLSK